MAQESQTGSDDSTDLDGVDERFFSGVWYAPEWGAFERYAPDRDADEVVVLDLDGDEVDRVDPVDFDEGDAYRVPEDAVDRPADFYTDTVDTLFQRAARGDAGWLPMEVEVGYRYAKEHVDVTEREE